MFKKRLSFHLSVDLSFLFLGNPTVATDLNNFKDIKYANK